MVYKVYRPYKLIFIDKKLANMLLASFFVLPKFLNFEELINIYG